MDNDIGGYHYGFGHVMVPHRISMAHNLVLAYGMCFMIHTRKSRTPTHQLSNLWFSFPFAILMLVVTEHTFCVNYEGLYGKMVRAVTLSGRLNPKRDPG